MESLMAAAAQSDGEAKARVRAFLDKRAAKTRPERGPSRPDQSRGELIKGRAQ